MPDYSKMSDQELLSLVNKPDYSKLSDEELLNIASNSSDIQSNSDYTPAEIAQLNAINKTNQIQQNNNVGIVEGLTGDVTKGALSSIAGTVDKLNAAKTILKNMTGLDADSGGNLAHISQSLKQSADSQPSLNNPILSGAAQFVGSIPDALAEFAGSGGGVGFIARSAALSALQEYNKDENVGDLAKGAIVGGTIGAALNKAPQALDTLSKLTAKWGVTAGKKYLQSITGMTNKEADQAIADINKFNLSSKKEAIDYGEAKSKSAQDLRDFKENTNLMVSQQKEQFDNEYLSAKDKSSSIIQEVKDSNNQLLNDLKETHINNTISLNNSKIDEIANVTEKTTQDLSDAVLRQSKNIAEAKNALDNELISLFDNSRKKLSSMVEGLNKNVGMAKNHSEQTGNDYVPTNIVKKELDSVINKYKGRFFQDNTGKETFNIGGIDVKVPTSGIEGYSGLKATAGSTPAVRGAINLINDVRQNLVDDFIKNGRTSLAAIEANQALLEGAISKGFAGEALPKDLAKILSDIKASISLTRTKLSEDGSVIPGLFDKYSNELAHLRPLAEANKAYSSNIDNLKNALSLYNDNIDGSLIPNPGKVFDALNKNNRSFITKLQQADMALPESDRIFNKVKSVYDNYKTIESTEKTNLSLIEKQVAQTRQLTRAKFNSMEQELRTIQRREYQEATSTVKEKVGITEQEQRKILEDIKNKQKEQLDLLKKDRDAKLDSLQSSINDRLQFLHIESILRGTRANQSSMARLGQNLSLYKTFNGAVTLNPASLLQGLAGSTLLSPTIAAKVVRSAINAPVTNQKTKEILKNNIMKSLLASKGIRLQQVKDNNKTSKTNNSR